MATETRDDSLPVLIEERKTKQERGLSLKYECMYISVFFYLSDVYELYSGVASAAGL